MDQVLYSPSMFDPPMIFTIGMSTYASLHVLDYAIYGEPLDGPGSGRTQAPGWPMVRDPNGIIKNVEMLIATPDSRNEEFLDLMRKLDGFGTKDFEIVSFTIPAGIITQPMYGASYKLQMTRLNADRTSFWKPFSVRLVAQKGII